MKTLRAEEDKSAQGVVRVPRDGPVLNPVLACWHRRLGD